MRQKSCPEGNLCSLRSCVPPQPLLLVVQRVPGPQALGEMPQPPLALLGAAPTLEEKGSRHRNGQGRPSSNGESWGERDQETKGRRKSIAEPYWPPIFSRATAEAWGKGAGRTQRAPGSRVALPAATLTGAKGRRQASQRTRPKRARMARAIAGGARSRRRGAPAPRLLSPACARAVRGGAGAALARPRQGTPCRCASPPPPTARRATPAGSASLLCRAPSPRPVPSSDLLRLPAFPTHAPSVPPPSPCPRAVTQRP